MIRSRNRKVNKRMDKGRETSDKRSERQKKRKTTKKGHTIKHQSHWFTDRPSKQLDYRNNK